MKNKMKKIAVLGYLSREEKLYEYVYIYVQKYIMCFLKKKEETKRSFLRKLIGCLGVGKEGDIFTVYAYVFLKFLSIRIY